MPPLFDPLSPAPGPMSAAQSSERSSPHGWTIEGAEALLGSLTGVISARVVAKPGGEVEEIHLLTTVDVAPKQTVRNVESALLAHFDLSVDHRKISVAQTRDEGPAVAQGPGAVHALPAAGDDRVLFVGLQVESQRSHQVRFGVELEFRGERYRGEDAGADVARTRMETAANATLRAIEAVIRADAEGTGEPDVALALDGVKVVEAFDRRYALAAVHALAGRQVTSLSGSALIEDSADKAVILAILQATDRWVRGRV